MRPRLLQALLLLLLLLDTGYSAQQYYRQPLDGDMAWNLLPAAEVAPILTDPLGWAAVSNGATYANPNRFFCHWVYRGYLLWVPRYLQNFVSPVSSVYLACALAKLLIHLLLLLVLSRLVVGPRGRPPAWLPAAALLAPLLQAAGYRNALGIVDPSTTYAFFYALPAVALLTYLVPFTDWLVHGARHRLAGWQFALLLALAPVVALSGPLNPGAVGVLAILGGIGWLGGARLPLQLRWLGVVVVALSAYSLYLGRYNTLTIANPLPWAARYARLPAGLFGLLTTKLAWPVLLTALGANYWWVGRLADGDRLRRAYVWLAGFALLYVLLLPLGGYRPYRPDVIRYDTLLPVTLAACWLYGLTSWRILRAVPTLRYAWLPLAVSLIFTLADGTPRPTNDCERAALERLAAAGPEPVATDCPVLFWDRVTDSAASTDNVRLLQRWGVVDGPRAYYQR